MPTEQETKPQPVAARDLFELCSEFESLMDARSEGLTLENYEKLFEEATVLRTIGNALFSEDLNRFAEERLASARTVLLTHQTQTT